MARGERPSKLVSELGDGHGSWSVSFRGCPDSVSGARGAGHVSCLATNGMRHSIRCLGTLCLAYRWDRCTAARNFVATPSSRDIFSRRTFCGVRWASRRARCRTQAIRFSESRSAAVSSTFMESLSKVREAPPGRHEAPILTVSATNPTRARVPVLLLGRVPIHPRSC